MFAFLVKYHLRSITHLIAKEWLNNNKCTKKLGLKNSKFRYIKANEEDGNARFTVHNDDWLIINPNSTTKLCKAILVLVFIYRGDYLKVIHKNLGTFGQKKYIWIFFLWRVNLRAKEVYYILTRLRHICNDIAKYNALRVAHWNNITVSGFVWKSWVIENQQNV